MSRDRKADDERGTLNPQIFITAFDGSKRQQIVFSDQIDYGPSWSPDGKYLAFSREKVINSECQITNSLTIVDYHSGLEIYTSPSRVTSSPVWYTEHNIVFSLETQDGMALKSIHINGQIETFVGNEKDEYLPLSIHLVNKFFCLKNEPFLLLLKGLWNLPISQITSSFKVFCC